MSSGCRHRIGFMGKTAETIRARARTASLRSDYRPRVRDALIWLSWTALGIRAVAPTPAVPEPPEHRCLVRETAHSYGDGIIHPLEAP